MGTLRCDHPDVERFIDAKREQNVLNNFNLSVLVTDKFMQAVAADAEWQLTYPSESAIQNGDTGSRAAQVYRTIPARDLWHKMILASHATAEPGMLFIDHIKDKDKLWQVVPGEEIDENEQTSPSATSVQADTRSE